MYSRNIIKIREKRINELRNFLLSKKLSGRDCYLQEIVNETKLPRGTVDRYLKKYLINEIQIYYEGPLKKIRYIGNQEKNKNISSY